MTPWRVLVYIANSQRQIIGTFRKGWGSNLGPSKLTVLGRFGKSYLPSESAGISSHWWFGDQIPEPLATKTEANLLFLEVPIADSWNLDPKEHCIIIPSLQVSASKNLSFRDLCTYLAHLFLYIHVTLYGWPCCLNHCHLVIRWGLDVGSFHVFFHLGPRDQQKHPTKG